jgi:tRNA G18 (ribose-2'-O)-methylase SpoU
MTQLPAIGPDSDITKSFLPAQRAKNGIAYAEGDTLAEEALRGAWEVQAVFIDGEFAATARGAKLCSMARTKGARVYSATTRVLAKLSAVESPPPIAVAARPTIFNADEFLSGARRLLILDRITDPGNAGALVRSAVAFGARAILTKGSVALTNDKLVRATAGVCFHDSACMALGPAAELAARLGRDGWTTVALDAHADVALQSFAPPPEARLALVIGNESAGVDWSAWGKSTRLRIEMAGRVESLNASISGALALYELARRDGVGGGA